MTSVEYDTSPTDLRSGVLTTLSIEAVMSSQLSFSLTELFMRM